MGFIKETLTKTHTVNDDLTISFCEHEYCVISFKKNLLKSHLH